MKQTIELKLKEFLEAYGWVYRFDGHSIFYSGWRSVSRTYSLRVQVSDTLLFFEVKLIPLSEIAPEKDRKSVFEFLLRLNRKISTIKLGIDDEDSITLLAEVFSEQLTYEYLSKLLGIIGYYAEKIQEEMYTYIHEIQSETRRSHRYLI